ncbi:MAG: hypothetical protein MK538_01950 [Planctomycetes bacterium]|nr:hypothetical protein [Planctomycetota bacterium]
MFRRNRVAGYEKLQLGVSGAGRYPSGYHRIEDNKFFECNRAVHIKTSDNLFVRLSILAQSTKDLLEKKEIRGEESESLVRCRISSSSGSTPTRC